MILKTALSPAHSSAHTSRHGMGSPWLERKTHTPTRKVLLRPWKPSEPLDPPHKNQWTSNFGVHRITQDMLTTGTPSPAQRNADSEELFKGFHWGSCKLRSTTWLWFSKWPHYFLSLQPWTDCASVSLTVNGDGISMQLMGLLWALNTMIIPTDIYMAPVVVSAW